MVSFFCAAGMAVCMIQNLDNVREYTCIERSQGYYQCARYPKEFTKQAHHGEPNDHTNKPTDS